MQITMFYLSGKCFWQNKINEKRTGDINNC